MATVGAFHGRTSLSSRKKEAKKNRQLCKQSIPVFITLQGQKSPHHADPTQMASTSKVGSHPSPDNIQGDSLTKNAGSEAKNIGIVMLPTQPSSEGLVTERSPNMPVPVRSNGHADTGAADENATFAAAICKGCTDLVSELRVINRGLAGAADIIDAMPHFCQQRTEQLLESKSTMITSNGNVHYSTPC
jgi:hypothetical protein